jgi:hypothetical protein
VWKAFALPGHPPRQIGVGEAEPNPYLPHKTAAALASIIGLVALIALAIFFYARLPRQRVSVLHVPLAQDSIAVSDPFELWGVSQAVQVTASAPMNDCWAGLDVALIDDASGEVRTTGFELSRFEGFDDEGDRWSEGDQTLSITFAAVPRGRYVLRAEVTLDPQSAARVPAQALIEVDSGVFVASPLLAAMLLLVIPPLWTTLRSSRFERRRWSESDHDEDDEDDE